MKPHVYIVSVIIHVDDYHATFARAFDDREGLDEYLRMMHYTWNGRTISTSDHPVPPIGVINTPDITVIKLSIS